MSQKPEVSARPEWFVHDADSPHLVGTRCEQSGTYHFPPEYTMSRAPGFPDSPLTELPLSTRGTLWSYTNAGYAPPAPYVQVTDPFEPFAIAAVELAEEQMVVLGQVVDGVGADDLHIGIEMELVSAPLFEDDEAVHMIWKWKPTAEANQQGASA
jgi:uncharacterized OB-fold protein